MRRRTGWLRSLAGLGFALLVLPVFAGAESALPAPKTVELASGVVLHYREMGSGPAVVFVHGSLSDLTYWHMQLPKFAAAGFHAISYSRRYDSPNQNKPEPGYSAITDAEDLAGLIRALHLGKVDVVGHSYGALTALFLTARHPELVRRLVLCEPPAVSLLAHLSGRDAPVGKRMLDDINERMVLPMQKAFRSGRDEEGVGIFIDYVFENPKAWDTMPETGREEEMKNVREWEVMLSSGEFFPQIKPAAVEGIHQPVLLISGENSYPFLGLIDQELLHLLPNSARVTLHGAGHGMWFQQPERCRTAVLAFLR